jgi:O-antigen/teichoic acid export membrane protein
LSPIITRIFSPDDYGAFVLFNSIVINITLVSSLKYSDSIVLQKDSYSRAQAIGLSLCTSFIGVFFFSTIILIISSYFGRYFNLSKIGSMMYLIPVSAFLGSVIEILVHRNISHKIFSANGSSGFLNHFGSRASNILLGFFVSAKSIWLVVGDLVGKLLSIGVLILSARPSSKKIKHFSSKINVRGMLSIAKEYKYFPLYYLPANLLLSLSGHIPIFFFQGKFGSGSVGMFALASSMLEIFNRLIPYAIAPVFLQKANELWVQSNNELGKKAYDLFLVMLLVSVFIFTGVALLGGTIFSLVFGAEWRNAGVYAEGLAIHNSLQFIVVALSEIYNVTKSQRFLLLTTIVNFLLRFVAVFIIVNGDFTQEQSILIYSLFSSVGALLYLWGIFKILRYKLVEVIGLATLGLLLILTVLTVNWKFLNW